jgi:hypothetical protein
MGGTGNASVDEMNEAYVCQQGSICMNGPLLDTRIVVTCSAMLFIFDEITPLQDGLVARSWRHEFLALKPLTRNGNAAFSGKEDARREDDFTVRAGIPTDETDDSDAKTRCLEA